MKLVLIDADSIIYIVGSNNRDLDPLEHSELIYANLESFLENIFSSTQATHYLGTFSAKVTFRNSVYKYAKYKGNRPEKPDFIVKWETVIKEYLVKNHGFLTPLNIEADDVVSLYQEKYPTAVIASPDKDLRQSKGYYFDYSKNTELEYIDDLKAMQNLYISLVMGDATDNIKGIPGMGEVKAKKLFEECVNAIEFESVLHDVYLKHFGEYYGPIILEETKLAIKLLKTTHPFYSGSLDEPKEEFIRAVPSFEDIFTKALNG